MSHIWVVMSHVMSSHVTCVRICDWPVGGKEVSLQEIRSWFEFVSGLFGIVLRGGYLYGAWPRTVRILIEFEFIVPELWQLVVFCTCQILPEGLKFVENFRPRMRLTYVTWLPICLIWVTYVSYKSHRSSHVTYEYQWVMPHDSKRPDAFICVTWLTHVTLCVTWLTHVTHMNESRRVYSCDTTHSCCVYLHMKWQNSLVCKISPIHDKARSYLTWSGDSNFQF